jgi:hypothetical protein
MSTSSCVALTRTSARQSRVCAVSPFWFSRSNLPLRAQQDFASKGLHATPRQQHQPLHLEQLRERRRLRTLAHPAFLSRWRGGANTPTPTPTTHHAPKFAVRKITEPECWSSNHGLSWLTDEWSDSQRAMRWHSATSTSAAFDFATDTSHPLARHVASATRHVLNE